MVKKSEQEKLEEINKRMEQLKIQKQQIQAKLNQKERKERTRKLIQMGAVFEKWFELHSLEEAEDVARTFQQMVKSHLQKNKT